MEDFENEIDADVDEDAETNSKLDSIWLGLIIGLIAPFLAFCILYATSSTRILVDYFLEYAIRMGALINNLTTCLTPNFLIFALFIWRKHYKSAKGLVIASASLTALLIIAKVVISLIIK